MSTLSVSPSSISVSAASSIHGDSRSDGSIPAESSHESPSVSSRDAQGARDSVANVAPVSSADVGSVSGTPRVILRLEALAALAVSLVAYAHLGGSWATFAMLFLVPDLAFLGYLAGPRVGAVAYNTTHSWLGPALLTLFGATTGLAVLPFVAVWSAHLGFDRALGYGLKHDASFTRTHLGTIGRPRA